MSAEETIAVLKKRFRPEAAKNLSATYLITIKGDGAAAYLTKISDGTCEFVEHSSSGYSPADCQITIDSDDLHQIISGRMSAMTAALSGVLAIEGELGLAMKLVPIFFEG
ncbi:MAG: SCP2 sterol-binding domain-containing protein [Candidatus Obscuribacterales bacterium]